MNEDLCHAAGAALGSDISPYCRTRPRDYTMLLNMSVYYSYDARVASKDRVLEHGLG